MIININIAHAQSVIIFSSSVRSERFINKFFSTYTMLPPIDLIAGTKRRNLWAFSIR